MTAKQAKAAQKRDRKARKAQGLPEPAPAPPEEPPEVHALVNGKPKGETASMEMIDGKLHAVARWRKLLVKERLPSNLGEQTLPFQKSYLRQVAIRLRKALELKVSPPIAPGAAAAEQVRRRAGRRRAKKEMSVILSNRVQTLLKMAETASKPENSWRNPEMFGKALALRDAAAFMVGRTDAINLARPCRWLDDGHTLAELALELGMTLAAAPDPEAGADPAKVAELKEELRAQDGVEAPPLIPPAPAFNEPVPLEPPAAADFEPEAEPAAVVPPPPTGKTRAKPGKAAAAPGAKR